MPDWAPPAQGRCPAVYTVDRYSRTLERIYALRAGEIDLGLERMQRTLALFGHPELKYPSFHIAGTNGKGSTAAMLHRVLTCAGYKTALYTSPHLASFTERIRVGESEITRDEVADLAEEVEERTAAAGITLTFFEYATAIAFVYYARSRIDVAVVEVGLGGRLDATNLVRPVVSAITTISKDHEAYLGSDLLSIAREKAGIIKSGVPVVFGPLTNEVEIFLRAAAEKGGSHGYFFGQDFRILLKSAGAFDYTGVTRDFAALRVALYGRHQRNNAAVALAALEVGRDVFPVTEQHVREGLSTVVWPGRFEILSDRPALILDGAHNGEGVRALVAALDDYRGSRKIKLLFASMADKDWRLMLDLLVPISKEIVVTRVEMERSADPRELAAHIPADVPNRVIEDAQHAVRSIIDNAAPDDIVVAAGSLYLIGEVRSAVGRPGG